MAIDMQLLVIVGIMFMFLICGGVTAFIILSKMRWRFKVTVIENVAGNGYSITRNDRARIVGFGDGGEEIFLLKKAKKYRIGYGKRIGTRHILWAIGEDGFWYNITFGDLDKKLMQLGVMPVDKNMRFANASIRKGIENRYNDKSWMEKYGAILYFGLFTITLIIFGIVMWIAFDKMNTISASNIEAIKSSQAVVDAASRLLTALANVQQGGTGTTGLLPA